MVLCAELIGCGSGGDSEFLEPQPGVQTNSAQISTSFPQIQVISPEKNSVVFSDAAVPFEATVTQDGNILDATVLWESSIDGVLDTSSGVANLSPGVHLLTATVSSAESTATSSFSISAVRKSDIVESLIFGSGLLSTSPSGCLRSREWAGWRRGSKLIVNIPGSMSSSKISLIHQFAQLVSSISNNNLIVETKIKETTSRQFETDEIDVIEDRNPQALGCFNNFACAQARYNEDGSIRYVSVVIAPDQVDSVIGHELGHAIFGFCHISGELILANNSLMSGPTEEFFAISSALPTMIDIFTVQEIFGSGLDPGATHQEAIDQGLIHPGD